MIRLLTILLVSLLALTGCEAFFIGIEEEGLEASMPTQASLNEEQSAMEHSNADANVEFVRAVNNGESWTFHVTVRHPDSGWEDYADGWDVILPDGTVLKASDDDVFTRLLLHPHETEQPFTRSQSGLVIPDGITEVTVRAHDLVDGFGGETITVDLTQSEGDGFSVE